jgi:hypothetical protein
MSGVICSAILLFTSDNCHDPFAALIPPIEEMCLSITSFWPWNEQGYLYDGWHGQCDSDCSVTSGGYRLPEKAEDYGGGYAACISGWTAVAEYPTAHLVTGWDDLVCVDSFGDPDYRKPFYHYGYERWVVPVDILAPFAHGLDCDWEISWERFGT